jgi:hypothetical protein
MSGGGGWKIVVALVLGPQLAAGDTQWLDAVLPYSKLISAKTKGCNVS